MKRVPFLMIVAASVFWSCNEKKAQTTTEENTQVRPAADSATVDSANTETVKLEEEKTTAEPVAAVKPEAPVQTAVAANSGVKPKFNPPHGEPFHRCDIQVGAPIDSQPAPTPAPAMMPPQNPGASNFNTNPIPAPQQPAAAPSAQNLGPKPALNPPHGEPHHRCDIQVGAPLI